MRVYTFRPIPCVHEQANLQASCIHIVTDCGSNSTQCLSPTHHLLIEFFEFMLTPYYQRQCCWMHHPLLLNVNHTPDTYILVYLYFH